MNVGSDTQATHHHASSADGRCTVKSEYLREYRMGAFPERLTVHPPISGIEHFYFMGGHVAFDDSAKFLLLWDDSDVIVFDYATSSVYSYHGPLRGRISGAELDGSRNQLVVHGWIEGQSFGAAVQIGAPQCPPGLGHVHDGVFMSTPASEHPNRHVAPTPSSALNRLFSRLLGAA